MVNTVSSVKSEISYSSGMAFEVSTSTANAKPESQAPFLTGDDAIKKAHELGAQSVALNPDTDRINNILSTDGQDANIVGVYGNMVFKRALGDTTPIADLQAKAQAVIAKNEATSVGQFVYGERQASPQPVLIVMTMRESETVEAEYKASRARGMERAQKGISEVPEEDFKLYKQQLELSGAGSDHGHNVVSWYCQEGLTYGNGKGYLAPDVVFQHEYVHNISPENDPSKVFDDYALYREQQGLPALDLNHDGIADKDQKAKALTDVFSGCEGGKRPSLAKAAHESTAAYLEMAYLAEQNAGKLEAEQNPGRACYMQPGSQKYQTRQVDGKPSQ